MALTAKQIYDLNNSMVAAQNVNLGTILSYLVGTLNASGSLTPTSNTTNVVTGLTTVTSATVALSGSPTLNNAYDTVTAGSVAGTIQIKCWTGGSDVPALSSGSYLSDVSWIATGT
jgi:hypothetical protein